MPLEDADIILGKIAIGRDYLSRGDALRLAKVLADAERRGRREAFHSAAVRLGMLERARADELTRLLETGELVCRGKCGRRVRLARLSARDSVACATCGGPVYVARPAGGPAPASSPPAPLVAAASDLPATAEEEQAPGRRTVLDLVAEGVVPAGVYNGRAATAPTTPMPIPALSLPASVAEPPSPRPAVHHAPPTATESSASSFVTFAGRDAEDGEGTQELEPPGTQGPGANELADKTWVSEGKIEALFEPFSLSAELQVLAPIGKGGMGTVYRARWNGRVVAVKVLAAPPDNPDVMARFEREVKLSGKLDHPNIVRVFATGRAGPGPEAGRPYYVMDYVQGRDLAAWLNQRPRTIPECVQKVVVLCRAMEHAHSRGVIHRDLKPGNVLVRDVDDEPTICDFGLARYRAEVQGLTRTGDILGTPSYMPPEQALGHRHKIGPPTDVYALGALLYHLVTKRPPFLGASAFLTISKVIKDPPEPPTKLNASVSPALERTVLKALSKEPIDRFHTCADLRKALEAPG